MRNVLHLIGVASIVLLLSLVAAGQIYHPTNILENGDFHQGLACYTTGTKGGNWQFYVSNNDVPPGNSSGYSGEVACPIGSSCLQGAIATAPVPVDANEKYELTGSYKCYAGGGAGSFQVITHYDNGTNGYPVYVGFTCDGTWHTIDSTFGPFSALPNPISMELAFYDTSSPTPLSLKIGDLRLTWLDANNNRIVPVQNENDRGARTVSVVQGGTGTPIPYVKVDGNPYFALGFYNVPPSDYPALKGSIVDANTALSSVTVTPPNKCFNTAEIPGLNLQDYRDWAYEHGLNLVPDSMYTVRPGLDDGTLHPNGTGAEAVLPSAVSEYGYHLANIGWMLADEPDLESQPSFLIGGTELQTLGGIAGANTNLPLLVNLFCPTHSYPPDCSSFRIDDYDGAGGVWGAEEYSDDWPGYNNIINAVTTFDSVHSGKLRPIWFALNKTSQNVMFSQAYFAIVKGVTGILYFDWSNFKGDATAQGYAETLFSQLSQLQAPILSGSAVSTITSPQGIPFLARSYNSQTYIISVNPYQNGGYHPASFTIPGLPSGTTIHVMFESRSFLSNINGFTDSLGLGEKSEHIYYYSN